ncbi:MAG: hypothetical protein COT84_01745 [Chlamydiae bacterium CG10_big_fil_rev_8_21_14_0_10_35_9]|nr:MAG: hypothetical protein COT84_01745 [Chlamydiae bacterium CG10_big_fil_rev_8_21_14_0_10_35_9]
MFNNITTYKAIEIQQNLGDLNTLQTAAENGLIVRLDYKKNIYTLQSGWSHSLSNFFIKWYKEGFVSAWKNQTSPLLQKIQSVFEDRLNIIKYESYAGIKQQEAKLEKQKSHTLFEQDKVYQTNRRELVTEASHKIAALKAHRELPNDQLQAGVALEKQKLLMAVKKLNNQFKEAQITALQTYHEKSVTLYDRKVEAIKEYKKKAASLNTILDNVQPMITRIMQKLEMPSFIHKLKGRFTLISELNDSLEYPEAPELAHQRAPELFTPLLEPKERLKEIQQFFQSLQEENLDLEIVRKVIRREKPVQLEEWRDAKKSQGQQVLYILEEMVSDLKKIKHDYSDYRQEVDRLKVHIMVELPTIPYQEIVASNLYQDIIAI